MLNDPWFTVRKIDEKTYAISELGHWEKVHSFLLIGDKKAALIDTGLGIDNIKRITDQLTPLPIDVITTHVHSDHIGSHGEYDRIFVHEAERDWLVHGIVGLSLEQIRQNTARDITIPVPESFDPNTYKPFQGEPTGILKDGDRVELGNRTLIIYHTPGHSPGHIVIFDEETGYLFTGDLLYDETPIYAFYPTTNPADLVNSLERLTQINHVSMIYGAHNTLGLLPEILDEVKNAVEYLRKHDFVRFGTGVHTFHRFRVQF
ncbi:MULTISPECIES: MBL fold metallo-hydrolase [Oceanobacillus]|uniref:MBL fold metallo-hydrolase n=1 Tax=Oceanobacillus aidingensis TaxID=645964 RepID=A0ABV9K168_9BACI|nr:MBL fold metallo-hydrolase [Oceanobacillus oncorhynchi]MDM8101795.1 MBL fold metallo-hydrolase [Oceanobacillus oncorhynchi]